jgi:hypothetical protein
VTAPTTNTPPTVTLTSPANGSALVAPATITAAATAADSDGSVTMVRFYRNGVLSGSDSTTPYSIAWTNLAAGSYAVVAEAVDDAGAATRSAAATVSVTAAPAPSPSPSPSGEGPIGYIISPSNDSTLIRPDDRLIEAIVTDHQSAITRVQFYDGTMLLGEVTRAPYALLWIPTTAGTHVLSLKMTNAAGVTSVSQTTTVTVR